MTMYIHEHREIKYKNAIIVNDASAARAGEFAAAARACGDSMRLDYYVYESETDWEFSVAGINATAKISSISYGIGVTRTERGVFEEKFIADVTHDKKRARDIVKVIADGFVTPGSLHEILEDMYASEYSVC